MSRLVPVTLCAYPQAARETAWLLPGRGAYRTVASKRYDGLWTACDEAGGPQPGGDSSDGIKPQGHETGRPLYYRGPGIVVTRTHIETTNSIYRIRDLVIENPTYFYAHPARLVALYCGALELLIAAGFGALNGSAGWILCVAGFVAAAGVGGAIWIDDYRNPRHMELTAWHRGRRVLLFASDDQRVFEQVRRAVVRALEANG
jgi:hypothetical protein